MNALPCIVCKKALENIDEAGNQPTYGLAFQSHGHYGTAVFDPMDGTFLELNICDRCLVDAGKGGLVLAGSPSVRSRSPLRPWQP